MTATEWDRAPYDPKTDALVRGWTWVVTDLDCDEQVCPNKQRIYLSFESASSDQEMALAHALAHVDLHALLTVAEFTLDQEKEAEDLALLRLGRFDPCDLTGTDL